MQTALSPTLKALTGEFFLKHSDADVKVAVASCLSEITRITAPDAPYDDDEMKVCTIFSATSSMDLTMLLKEPLVNQLNFTDEFFSSRRCFS